LVCVEFGRQIQALPDCFLIAICSPVIHNLVQTSVSVLWLFNINSIFDIWYVYGSLNLFHKILQHNIGNNGQITILKRDGGDGLDMSYTCLLTCYLGFGFRWTPKLKRGKE
jgi:hypothetical protein